MLNSIRYGKQRKIEFDFSKYREFQNAEDAENWGRLYYDRWAKCHVKYLKNKDYHSSPIVLYSNNAYKVNEYKRNPSPDSLYRCYKELAENDIPNAIISAPRTPEDIIVYRKISGTISKYFPKQNRFMMPLYEKGFLSTGLVCENVVKNVHTHRNTPNGDNFILLRIFVPKDTEAVFVDSIGELYLSSEIELLINHNYYLLPISYPKKYSSEYEQYKFMDCLLSKQNKI